MTLVGFCLPGLSTQHVRGAGPRSALSSSFAGVAPRQLHTCRCCPSLGDALPGPFLQVRSVSQVFSHFHLSADSQSGTQPSCPARLLSFPARGSAAVALGHSGASSAVWLAQPTLCPQRGGEMWDVEHVVVAGKGWWGCVDGTQANLAQRDGLSSLTCSRGQGLALKATRRSCWPGGGWASSERVGAREP